VLVLAQPARAAVGFTIDGGRLVDANGNDFVMRGVSHAHTWYPGETGALSDIASLGANTVRVVLSSGQRWTQNGPDEVAGIIEECRANSLICMLEVHDTTGFGEEGAAATLDQAVDYWISLADVLAGQEDHILVNIGNEPYGNDAATVANWAADTSAAIGRLRDAGFDHTLVADAPNWGQDWSFTMRDNAAEVFASDPAANTMFSIHMYGVFDTADEVGSYLDTFVEAGLPITVGEFGHNHSDGDPDEDAIMATAEALGVGYIGWSWSGNGGGVEYLDMVDGFDVTSLTEWGERIFNGENGIAATARPATVYSGGAPAAPGDGGPSGEPTVEASEVAPSEPVESGDPVLPPTDPTGQDDDPAPPAEPAPGGGFDLDGIRGFLMQVLTMLLGLFPGN